MKELEDLELTKEKLNTLQELKLNDLNAKFSQIIKKYRNYYELISQIKMHLETILKSDNQSLDTILLFKEKFGEPDDITLTDLISKLIENFDKHKESQKEDTYSPFLEEILNEIKEIYDKNDDFYIEESIRLKKEIKKKIESKNFSNIETKDLKDYLIYDPNNNEEKSEEKAEDTSKINYKIFTNDKSELWHNIITTTNIDDLPNRLKEYNVIDFKKDEDIKEQYPSIKRAYLLIAGLEETIKTDPNKFLYNNLTNLNKLLVKAQSFKNKDSYKNLNKAFNDLKSKIFGNKKYFNGNNWSYFFYKKGIGSLGNISNLKFLQNNIRIKTEDELKKSNPHLDSQGKFNNDNDKKEFNKNLLLAEKAFEDLFSRTTIYETLKLLSDQTGKNYLKTNLNKSIKDIFYPLTELISIDDPDKKINSLTKQESSKLYIDVDYFLKNLDLKTKDESGNDITLNTFEDRIKLYIIKNIIKLFYPSVNSSLNEEFKNKHDNKYLVLKEKNLRKNLEKINLDELITIFSYLKNNNEKDMTKIIKYAKKYQKDDQQLQNIIQNFNSKYGTKLKFTIFENKRNLLLDSWKIQKPFNYRVHET